ncbi:hypothetical protein J9B83_13700 [Marinomonas sp. A79]|uniref:General secretion pathway, M protein n=1 Tax=Marinomonas vulgaris TaxID=2823372 RepID=A0ABS5HEX3_9GAMM|nr:hypothetical protein [Marinomonas vulgaris]MBR7889968.1 hypothetical protein [Marinomonas vulgaris]
MSLSQYWQANKHTLLRINASTLVLLLVVQAAAWYPILSASQDRLDRQTAQRDKEMNQERKRHTYVKALQQLQLKEATWARYSVKASDNENELEWHIDGAASLAQWQRILESVEEHFALSLLSVSWHLQPNGEWQGTLGFQVNPPKRQREYHNWLPSRLGAERFVQADWQLLSTMRIADVTAALIAHKEQRYWVREGSWLPDMGLAVNRVTTSAVTLMAKDGSQPTVTIMETGGSHD